MITNKNLTGTSEFETVTDPREIAMEFAMNHADIVQLIFTLFLGVLLGLVAANLAVIVASLSRHEEVARSIKRSLSNYLWLLRMGGDGDRGHHVPSKHA
jgi:hypothetical protein